MKTLALILAAALPFTAFAQEKKGMKEKPRLVEPTDEELQKLGGFIPAPVDDEFAPRNVQIELMVVTVADDDAIPLIETLRIPEKVEAGYQQLLGLIKAKKAKVVSTPTIITKSGNRAVAENITEVRYATEFDTNGAGPALKDAAEGEAPPGPKAPPAQGVIPTTFETRNSGVTLEIEPAIGPDGKMVDMHLAAQDIQLVGWDAVTVKQDKEVKVSVPQPRFHTNKVTQGLSLTSGQRMMIGSFRAAGDADRMEIFLLKVSVIRARPAAKK